MVEKHGLKGEFYASSESRSCGLAVGYPSSRVDTRAGSWRQLLKFGSLRGAHTRWHNNGLLQLPPRLHWSNRLHLEIYAPSQRGRSAQRPLLRARLRVRCDLPGNQQLYRIKNWICRSSGPVTHNRLRDLSARLRRSYRLRGPTSTQPIGLLHCRARVAVAGLLHRVKRSRATSVWAMPETVHGFHPVSRCHCVSR